jgi:hypothetical protein
MRANSGRIGAGVRQLRGIRRIVPHSETPTEQGKPQMFRGVETQLFSI